jgi:hypothetical protein
MSPGRKPQSVAVVIVATLAEVDVPTIAHPPKAGIAETLVGDRKESPVIVLLV